MSFIIGADLYGAHVCQFYKKMYYLQAVWMQNDKSKYYYSTVLSTILY